ncbi:tyrosine-type recombinase/integrase [Pseudomonas matsuisoli]|nr:tyrosine-type recombinase/integrase [Pseudomonas matsuisoli]
MINSKSIQHALRVFHLDNPEASWSELKARLRDLGEDILATPTSWEALDAMSMNYSDMGEALHGISRTHALTVPQARMVNAGQQMMRAAESRLKGDTKPLLGMIEELDQEEDLNSLCLTSPSLSVGAPQATHREPLSWDTLTASYLEEHATHLKASTLASTKTNFKVIGEAMSATGLNDLRLHTRADIQKLRTKLMDGRAGSTVNNLLSKLVMVLDWGVLSELLAKNHATKMKLRKDADSKRVSFSREQVVSLMGHVAGLPLDSWERWSISLLAVTGARVGEVAHLSRADIRQVDGLWCIDINENAEGKSIKNKHSSRLVPLVDGALGFDLSAFLKAVQLGALPSEHGITPPKASKELNAVLRAALGESQKDTQKLHSLRHHLSSSMQAAGVQTHFAQAVTGHSTGTITYDNYGSGVSVKSKHEAIERALHKDVRIDL